jgi:hypothetical protein
VDCDGVDDSIGGAAISTYLAAGTKTIALWYTPTAPAPAGGSFCHDGANVEGILSNTGGTKRIFATWRRQDRLCMGNNDGATDEVMYDTAETTFAGTPIHLAMTHTGGTITLYANGTQITTASSGDTSSLTDSLTLCGNTGTFAAAEGRFHHVALYNVVVPAEEIAILATSKRPRLRRTLPTGEWLFDNCGDGAAGNAVAFRDHSGNARTITADDGANNTGVTCRAGALLTGIGGIQ